MNWLDSISRTHADALSAPVSCAVSNQPAASAVTPS